MQAFLEAAGENEPIMTVANIPLKMPEVLVEVGAPIQYGVVPLCSVKGPSAWCFSPQVPGKAMLWEKATAYISFVNPLPVTLKGGVFTVEGAGLLSATHVYVK